MSRRDPYETARWERIDDTHRPVHDRTIESSRLKVPGGWLYRTVAFHTQMPGGAACSVSQTFVPDPHQT